MLDNQNFLTNQNLSCNQYDIINKCTRCTNEIQSCVCNQVTICNVCNNNILNCTCNITIKCNVCNNDICCCDKNMSYMDIYTSWEYIIVIGVLLLIYIPFLMSYFFGIYSPWYDNLKKDVSDTWVIAGLWIVVTIISYIGLYILWRNPTPETISRNLIVSVLFFLGNVILLAWAIIFYQFQNIATATWIALILFIFEFWIFIYVWNIDRLAAIFLLPQVGMYLYFFYAMVHLACINDIIL